MNDIAEIGSCEINCAEEDWMFRLGQLAHSANKVIVKDFLPNCANNAFVKAICLHHDLAVFSQDNDLIFEKRAALYRRTA